MPASGQTEVPDDGPKRTWQVVVVDGNEFPNMDGPLHVHGTSDPFVRLAPGGGKYLQTSTKFRCRARTGVANWNELFKVRLPPDTAFMEVEVRDHDVHGSIRKGAQHLRDKESMYLYDALRQIEIGAGPVSLDEHLAKRMSQSDYLGRGELLMEEGFHNVTIFDKKGKRAGRVGIIVTELDKDEDGPGLLKKAMPSGHHGPPSWAWLFLVSLAVWHPGSSVLLTTLSTASLGTAFFLLGLAVLKRFDIDGDGEIDFGEFKQLLPRLISSAAHADLSEEGIRALFDKIDADNSGALEPDELAAFVLRTFASGFKKKVSKLEVVQKVDDVRTNGENTLKETFYELTDFKTTKGKIVLGCVVTLYIIIMIIMFWWKVPY